MDRSRIATEFGLGMQYERAGSNIAYPVRLLSTEKIVMRQTRSLYPRNELPKGLPSRLLGPET